MSAIGPQRTLNCCRRADPRSLLFLIATPSLPRQKFRNLLSGLVDRIYAVEVTVAALNLDVLDRRAIRLDHLRGLVHSVGGKIRSSSLVMRRTGASIFLSPLGEIAATRDKELTGLDKVEEVVGVRRRHARLPRGVKRRLDRVLAAESPATGPALP